MMDGRIADKLRDQANEIQKMLQGEEWALFVNFLRRRKQFFQEQMNGSVKANDMDQAKQYHALMEEMDALAGAFKKEPQRLERIINE